VSGGFRLDLPEELVDLIAERAAALVAEQRERPTPPSPWMTVDEAAEHLRCSRQRVFDLRSAGVLTAHREGSRALLSRAEVEALVVVGDRAPRPRPPHKI
jgi:excisionase family DNA binding protein